MKFVVTGEDQLFGPWLMEQTGGTWVSGKGSTIGLIEAGASISAACYYESFNGASILMHCAGTGRNWLDREFLWYCFHYPFYELGVEKIISPVGSNNNNCLRFIKHLGFELEATLKNAYPKGDMLLFTMTIKQCKWLSLRNKYRGKTLSSSST